MNPETLTLNPGTLGLLPKLDCGACGYKTCIEFSTAVDNSETDLKRCIHVRSAERKGTNHANCLSCAGENLGAKLEWKDSLKREFDFILDIFEGEPGPKETILPYNPTLVKELGVKKGDIMIGRPMGMSCGCPVTHCGQVMAVDAKNGVLVWCVTGPLNSRQNGCKDIGYYSAQAYEGIVAKTRQELRIGMRYWFLPYRCMLQWRHSGLINFINRSKSGLQVRIEGLFIG